MEWESRDYEIVMGNALSKDRALNTVDFEKRNELLPKLKHPYMAIKK